ncbi:MAG: hypothetical protein LC798_19860 [Chloroflexi bacterium]|nr:hypothetical protein [Chloroflexota bacterium]
MTDLALRQTEIADRIGDVLDILADDSAPIEDWAAAYAIAQQVRLRVDRALKARRDDLIVGMERGGLKSLGPLTVKSAAVDPRYVCNERDNWEDATTQDALAALRRDPATREYVRTIPAHLEVDVDRMTEDMRLGVHGAIHLYRALNDHGWRVERDRRKSLAVREVRAPKGEAA